MSRIINRCRLIIFGLLGRVAPVLLSKILYRRSLHSKLNLKDPKTFNEKLMWLKLNCYSKDPVVWACADKYCVRDYAIKKGVDESNLPTLLGVYQDPKDIDFDSLPQKFALKCTHGYGYNIICTDKSALDQKEAVRKLRKWLGTKFGYASAETHYTHIKPRIICERFIENINGAWPFDYKIYCFNGKPEFLLVTSQREMGTKRNWFDFEWNELNYGFEEDRNKDELKKPVSLEQMIDIAKKVSSEFPFVRVDFYQYGSKAIMGEMTFSPAADVSTHYNEEASVALGNMLRLPM